MTDGVKFIFKTLIKVPVIILVAYLIFNIFAFAFTYFRLLGFSYVAMQTAVENNFIPPEEQETLTSYLDSLETYMVSNLALGCDTNTTNDAVNGGPYIDITQPDNDNIKVQYGTPMTITVSAKYTWIFPLVNTSKYDDDNPKDGPNAMGLTYNENSDNNIVISYTIPGLKYYPDMS